MKNLTNPLARIGGATTEDKINENITVKIVTKEDKDLERTR